MTSIYKVFSDNFSDGVLSGGGVSISAHGGRPGVYRDIHEKPDDQTKPTPGARRIADDVTDSEEGSRPGQEDDPEKGEDESTIERSVDPVSEQPEGAYTQTGADPDQNEKQTAHIPLP